LRGHEIAVVGRYGNGGCRGCDKKRCALYYQRHREEKSKKIKIYDQKNKKRLSEYRKRWYQENRERILEQKKRYRLSGRGRLVHERYTMNSEHRRKTANRMRASYWRKKKAKEAA
jgi:hypothetical protein